jgi:hypothetical protein
MTRHCRNPSRIRVCGLPSGDRPSSGGSDPGPAFGILAGCSWQQFCTSPRVSHARRVDVTMARKISPRRRQPPQKGSSDSIMRGAPRSGHRLRRLPNAHTLGRRPKVLRYWTTQIPRSWTSDTRTPGSSVGRSGEPPRSTTGKGYAVSGNVIPDSSAGIVVLADDIAHIPA